MKHPQHLLLIRTTVLSFGSTVLAVGMLAGCYNTHDDLASVRGVAISESAVLHGAGIAVKCADGLIASTTTDSDGNFSTLARGNFPCLIEATDGKFKLHSVATNSNRVVVSPLTERVVRLLSQERIDTASFFAKFDASQAVTIDHDKLKQAQTQIQHELKTSDLRLSAINDLGLTKKIR